jgi:hypothetical protein
VISLKENLLQVLSDLDSKHELPCGLGCTDKERVIVSNMIDDLCADPSNILVQKNGKIDVKDVLGEWDLLYTSSRTMVINKSLSGMGRSSSDSAHMATLRKTFTGSKYLGFVEYVETFASAAGNDAASFDVTISGEWMLQPESNPFTGEPTTAIRVDPEIVKYGPTSNKADNWGSLGPIKLLDILYMGTDLHITRNNVNPDTLFVFQRV